MDSYTVAYLVIAFVILIAIALMVRGIQFVQPGQVGLVFVFGRFQKAILPGFAYVNPSFATVVRKIVVGSGPNKALGTVGVARAALTPDGPLGSVDLGDRTVSARSDAPIAAGTRVRVIQDSELGTILVAVDRVPLAPKPADVGSNEPLH